jgi:hypothetical protein
LSRAIVFLGKIPPQTGRPNHRKPNSRRDQAAKPSHLIALQRGPTGKPWSAMTVIRARDRLAAT